MARKEEGQGPSRPAPQPGTGEGWLPPLPAWVPWLVFAILALVLGGAGNYVYRTQSAQFREHVNEQLGAVAELKAGQIEQWLAERRADAAVLRAGSLSLSGVLRAGRPGAQVNAERVRRSLQAFKEGHGLAAIELFDRNGISLLQLGGESAPDPGLQRVLADALATGQLQFSDLEAPETPEGGVHLHFAVPVGEDPAAQRVDGALVLSIDPRSFLFPLIQSWPLPSGSGETVLVRRDGEEVVFLNRLRHVDKKPFEPRVPVSRTEVPAVQAVLRGAGSYEGTDYRGVRVVSAFRKVEGTSWMVGSKTDLEEVMAPMEQRAAFMFTLVGLAIAASALFVGFFWREQRNRYLLGRYRDQLERRALVQHFDHVVNYARDIILLMDAEGRLVDANDAALAAYGYARDELSGLGLHELRAPEALATLERDMKLAARPGGVLFETVHRRRDGSTFPVEVSERVIEVDGRPFRQAIVRDISARRAAEAEIHRLNTAYALLSETNQAIVRVVDERELFERICRAAVVAGGYRGAWIGVLDEPVRQVRPVARAGEVGEDLHSIPLGPEAMLPEAAGPLDLALHEGRPYVCDDASAGDAPALCREAGRRAGARALAVVPFARTDKSAGVLSLYAAEPGAFDARVVELLQEMAFDISFALEHIAREEERRAALKALQESEELFRGVVEQNVSAIFILADGCFEYVNPRAAEILGYGRTELEGMPVLRVVSASDRHAVTEQFRQLMSGAVRSISQNFVAVRRDGTPVEIGAHGTRAVFGGKPVVIGVAQDIGERKRAEEEIRHYVARLEEAMLTTVEAVSAMVELRDPYTAGHERRVGELAAAIGAELGLPGETVKGLRITGYVHDIGKVRVPAEILSKPGRLSANEFAIVKEHARSGYDILKEVQFPWPVAQVILQHHERLDGSGYPQGLKDGAIMLEARVLAVADVVESMSTHWPYRPALGLDAALEEIERNAGRLYDPEAVAACLRLFREKGYALPS